MKKALQNIWDVFSEFYSWIDPEELEGDDDDDDETKILMKMTSDRLRRESLDRCPRAEKPIGFRRSTGSATRRPAICG